MNYKDPSEMWQDFQDYKTFIKANPRTKREYVGRDGKEKDTPLMTPLTLEGLINFVWDKRDFCMRDYLYSKDERYEPFSNICTRVKENIRQDQIEGGMVGQYNASITQRLNGLSDKQEVKQETTIRDLTIEIVDTNIPLAGAEKDIEE